MPESGIDLSIEINATDANSDALQRIFAQYTFWLLEEYWSFNDNKRRQQAGQFAPNFRFTLNTDDRETKPLSDFVSMKSLCETAKRHLAQHMMQSEVLALYEEIRNAENQEGQDA